MRPDPFGKKPEPKPEPNAALRELAARLKKLSYRDLQQLSRALYTALPEVEGDDRNVAEALLRAADNLENA